MPVALSSSTIFCRLTLGDAWGVQVNNETEIGGVYKRKHGVGLADVGSKSVAIDFDKSAKLSGQAAVNHTTAETFICCIPLTLSCASERR